MKKGVERRKPGVLTNEEIVREVLHTLAIEGIELTDAEKEAFVTNVEDGTCEEGIARILERYGASNG